FAKAKGRLSSDEERAYVRSLLDAPAHMEKVLTLDRFFDDASKVLKSYKGFLYLGRGIHFPVALEGALKLKELAYMHAEGYPAGEMKHGQIVLMEEGLPVVIVMPSPSGRALLHQKMLSNIAEVKARGARTIVIAEE